MISTVHKRTSLLKHVQGADQVFDFDRQIDADKVAPTCAVANLFLTEDTELNPKFVMGANFLKAGVTLKELRFPSFLLGASTLLLLGNFGIITHTL